MTERVYNFTAGPTTLPLSVLEKARDELLDFRGNGLSIVELSHRSSTFEGLVEEARNALREYLGIPDNFEVLFLQGGASLQFYMAPLNLLLPNRPADAINTGFWAKLAITELERFGSCRIVAGSEDQKYTYIPKIKREAFNPDASYVYLVSNNTIFGTQWRDFPDTGGVPLVADMTSDILSRPLDFSKFGLIFASAQKNIGISGATVVIIRKDLAERCSPAVATCLQYRTHIRAQTLYNTPPSFAIYMISLMMEWIKQEGSVEELEKRSQEKSRILYDLIDSSGFYSNEVRLEDRSYINVVFRIRQENAALEELFVEKAKEQRIVGVRGHKAAGGLRVSLYNAVTPEAVRALAGFMREFESRYG